MANTRSSGPLLLVLIIQLAFVDTASLQEPSFSRERAQLGSDCWYLQGKK